MAEKKDLKVVVVKKGKMVLFFAVWRCGYNNKGQGTDQVKKHEELLEVAPGGASEAWVETRRQELERKVLDNEG